MGIFSGIGTALGGVFGGPTGASIGAGIGGALDADGANDDARSAAAASIPVFNAQLQQPISDQLDRVGDTNVASFEGPRVAGFTGDQNTGFGLTNQLVSALGNQASTTGAGFNDFASGARIGNNVFLDDAIQATRDSAFTDLTRNQLPNIRNNAVASGGVGGSRQGIAEGLALSDLNSDLARFELDARQNQFNTDQSQQLQALINQGNILSNQTAGQDLLFRTGAVQQDQNQAEINANREQFDEQNIDQFLRDQELLRILIGGPAGTPPVASQTDPFAAGIGSALTASQLFGGPAQSPEPAQFIPGTGSTGVGPTIR